MEIEPYLTGLGLSSKEVSAYLALLELGESHIVPISKKIGIVRTSLVYVLEKLRAAGLVEVVEKSGRNLYAPMPPRKIISSYRRKRDELDNQIAKLEGVLPQLDAMAGSSFEARIRVYQGVKEIKQIYEDILHAPINEYWYVGDASKIEELVGVEYLKRWIRRRVEKKIKAKTIRVRSGEISDPLYQSAPDLLRTIRFASPNFESPAHIFIFADTVAIVTTKREAVGLVIQSRDFATTMKGWFAELWRNLK